MSEKTDKYEGEVIKSNSLLNESICIVINFFMRDKSRKAIDINIFNNFFSIKIYGDFLEFRKFDSQLLKALLNLSNQVYYITIKDKVKNSKVLDFSDAQSGMYNERHVSTISVEDKTNSVNFIFYNSYNKQILKELCQEERQSSLKKYVNDVYTDAFSYLKIRCFNEILQPKEKDGILLEDRNIDNNIKIELYKMNHNYKSVEVVVNGIRLKEKVDSKIINWNKYPYRQKGYSFRKLCIFIYINRDYIDLNTRIDIIDVLKSVQVVLEELINKHKDNFRNDKLYLNLHYDKNKMERIIQKTDSSNALEAVKFVLDKFYKDM